MPVRPLRAIALAGALALSACATAPGFAPDARQAFDGFVAINPPRAEVPVGALWIDGYGPVGKGASADNLETVHSISNLTVDRNLQLSLSLGMLDLLHVDPKARGHYAARFGDLSIVRIKDVSRLSSADGAPRILEALKAGTVSVSSDSELGFSGQKSGSQAEVQGSGSTDSTRSDALEAHDMIIAIRVATTERTRSKDRALEIGTDGMSARLDQWVIAISRTCPAPAPAASAAVRPGSADALQSAPASPARAAPGADAACPPRVSIAPADGQATAAAEEVPFGPDLQARLKLPVPLPDRRGGLYDTLALRWIAGCADPKQKGCARAPRLIACYEGTRVTTRKSIEAPGW